MRTLILDDVTASLALRGLRSRGVVNVTVAAAERLLYKWRIEFIKRTKAAAEAERVKTITLVSVEPHPAITRRWLGAWAIAHGLKVLQFEEHRGRLSLSHELKITVAGHPADIREFHDDVRGDAWTAESGGDPIDWIITPIVVSGVRAAKRKWQGRNDPSRESAANVPDGPRTVVYWKWEEAGEDGMGVGPVWVDRYELGSVEPDVSEEWPHRAKRADALAYAREHGFTFLADE